MVIESLWVIQSCQVLVATEEKTGQNLASGLKERDLLKTT